MSFLYPELSKMYAAASTSADRKTILLVIETGTSIKTDFITKLTGPTLNRYRTGSLSTYLLVLMLRR
jgi:hypothetical protein